MPSIDLGQVVGPQGATGPQGPQGIQGTPGPNQITSGTSTNLTGILSGSGGVVGVRPVDTEPNPLNESNLITSAAVAEAIASVVSTEIVTVSIPSFSALPVTVQNAAITADHVLLNYHLSNSRAALGDWTVHCADGSVTVSGYMSSSIPTALTLVLGRAGATI